MSRVRIPSPAPILCRRVAIDSAGRPLTIGVAVSIRLPAPVPGIRFDVATPAGKVAAYELGKGGRFFSCTASMPRGRAWNSHHWRCGWRRSAGWCWSTGSDSAPRSALTRPIGPSSTPISSSASGSPPAAGGDGRRRCRAVPARAVRRRFGGGPSGTVRPNRTHQPHRVRPLQGRSGSRIREPLPVSTGDRDRPAAVRDPRPAASDSLVSSARSSRILRASGASTSSIAGGPASSRARIALRWRSLPAYSTIFGQKEPTAGSRTRHCSSSAIIRASPTLRPPRRSWLPTTTCKPSRSRTSGDLPAAGTAGHYGRGRRGVRGQRIRLTRPFEQGYVSGSSSSITCASTHQMSSSRLKNRYLPSGENVAPPASGSNPCADRSIA